LQCGRDAFSKNFDGLTSASGSPRCLACDDALRPSETYLMKIEVGVAWTDVVKDAGNCAPYTSPRFF
jgi:hypothetical protein